MARRRRKDDTLLLTWPEADHAESYRLLLRDSSTDRLIAKIECPRPSHHLSIRRLHPDHHYQWGVQRRADKFDEWGYHLPYMRLFRAADPPSPTELSWEPTGASVYRVVINDKDLDLAVIKDALIGNRYPVDWRRLLAGHEHMYAVQELVEGDSEGWRTVYDYQPLPRAPADVHVEFRAEPTPPQPGERPLIFLWTCDTEANVRRMQDADPGRAVDQHIFGRDGEREYGINFMMDLLEEFNFRGTFFVDILMEHQFGRAELERTIEAIVGRGHDLQLHLHPSPNLLFAADPALSRFAPALARDDRDLFRGALDLSVELFVERVGYAPIAYRSGAYHLSDAFLDVLPEFGIRIDSSLYPFKNCRTSDWMRTRSEPFWVGDVLEIPVGWMLRTGDAGDPAGGGAGGAGSGSERRFEQEQLAPIKHGVHQDAVAEYRPPATTSAPATIVYLAHSFSFLTQRRPRGARLHDDWNRRYAEHLPEETFRQLRMGSESDLVFFEPPPDTDRIAVMTRLLHGLAARTDVVPGTFRELHEAGLERWSGERSMPVDTIPAWDEDAQSATSAPLQVYSRGLLERMHCDRVPA